MKYPSLFIPTESEAIQLPSGQMVQVPKVSPQFQKWDGQAINDDYNGKTILKYAGKPAFAELVVLRILQDDGWDGVWVDTFGHAYRTEFWPKNRAELPATQQNFLDQIFALDDAHKRCWDVFAWKNDLLLFAELKRRGRDKIRDTQRAWLQTGLNSGLPIASYLIVEWSTQEH